MEKVKIGQVNKSLANPSYYQNVLHELKEIIIKGQNKAYKAAILGK